MSMAERRLKRGENSDLCGLDLPDMEGGHPRDGCDIETSHQDPLDCLDDSEDKGFWSQESDAIPVETPEDDGVFREDQACQGFSCGGAPLGCSDKRYCSHPERRGF